MFLFRVLKGSEGFGLPSSYVRGLGFRGLGFRVLVLWLPVGIPSVS